MTYIEYLNNFNQWLESNALTGCSQLLYFKLLNVFNRAGWPEYVQVDNLRLMAMADVKTEKSLIRARDKLIEAGLISYKKGKKGAPGLYSLKKTCNFYSINDREKEIHCKIYSESDSEYDSEYDSESDSHIKTKTKTVIPLSPSLCDEGLGKVMTAYLDRINPTASQTSLEELKGYVKHLGAEVCLRAIDQTLDAGPEKTNWPYLHGILRRLSKQGVRSLADWDAIEAKRDQERRSWQSAPSRDALKGPAPMPCAPGEADSRARERMDELRVFMAQEKQKEAQHTGDEPQDSQGEGPGIIYLNCCQG